LYASPTTGGLLGHPAQGLVGRDIHALAHSEDRQRLADLFAAIAAEPGHTASLELRFRRADDSWRWIEAVGTNRLEETRVQAIIVHFLEARSSPPAPRSLDMLESQFRVLLENAAHITAILDAGQTI